MNFKAVLFDLDGTLADTAPGILFSMQAALERFGISEDQKNLRQYIGPRLTYTFSNYLPEEKISEAVAAYREVYLGGAIYKAELYPGMRQLLLALHESGCKVCLATAKPKATAMLLLEHWQLTPYFTVIGGVEEEKGINTKAAVIAEVLRQLELSPQEVLMVGDRKDDLNGAAACQVPAAGAAWGYGLEGELEAFSPYCILQTPQELEPVVLGDFLNKTAPARPDEKETAQRRRRILWVSLAAVLLAAGILFAGLVGGQKVPERQPGSNDLPFHLTLLPETENAGEGYLEETLFLGDSNTVRLCNFGKIRLQNTLGYVGLGVQDVIGKECIWFEGYESPVTMPRAVELLQPRRVVMMLGTNNTYMSVDTFIDEYARAYDAVHAAYPAADIIIASVPPIGRDRQSAAVGSNKIKDFNTALLELAESKGAWFLNVYEVLADSEGFLKAGCGESDGIHLTEKGASLLIEYLCCHSLDTPDERGNLTERPVRIPASEMPTESEATAAWEENNRLPAAESAPAESESVPAESESAPAAPESIPAESESTPAENESIPAESESAPAESLPAVKPEEQLPAESTPAVSMPPESTPAESLPAQSESIPAESAPVPEQPAESLPEPDDTASSANG